jgi:hypothetical protein
MQLVQWLHRQVRVACSYLIILMLVMIIKKGNNLRFSLANIGFCFYFIMILLENLSFV